MNGIYKDNVMTIITIWVIKTMIMRWVGHGTYIAEARANR